MNAREVGLNQVLLEFEELRVRLSEAEETLEAIRQGEVDALVVYGDRGEQVFTLRGAEQPYREFVEQMQEGAVSLSTDGLVLWANHRFAEMLGQPLSSVIGSKLIDWIDPASILAFEALFAGTSYGVRRAELRMVGVAASLPVMASVSPIASESSAAHAVTLTDLSLHERHDQVMRSERLTRTILEQATEAVVVCDLDGRVTHANPAARRLGILASESPLSRPAQLSLIDGRSFHEALAAAKQGGTIRGIEAQVSGAMGLRELLVGIAPIDVPEGGVVVTLSDITERNAAMRLTREMNETLERRVDERTEELTALNRELEGFCYSVSHDLRAPLRGMNSACRILMQDFGDQIPAAAFGELERIARNTTRLAKLMDDLLAFSRLGRKPMHRENIDLTQLGRSIAEEVGEEGVQISVADHMMANGDPSLVRLMLGNLIANAVKFSKGHAGAQVWIEPASGEMQEGTFVVRDNGIGFRPEYAERIFLPFERLHNDSEYPGTGIGLANVERIIRRHGGKVWAKGEPGKGATFYFRLTPPE